MPFTASFFHGFNPFKKPHLTHFLRRRQPRKEPIKVLVTDATGQVGSALVYMIARGLMFGEDQPVILHMLDIAEAKKAPDAEAKKGADAAAKKAPDAEAKERADAQAKEGADAEAKKAAKKRAQYVKAKKAPAAEAKKDPDAEAKKGADAEDQKGVKMELLHQPLPLLQGVVLTCNVDEACAGVKVAVMLAGFPLEDNMDKREFLAKNAYMYKDQAAALQKHAAPNCKVLVVADPANTNALILKHLAPKIPANNITCLTRLPYKIVMTGLAERIEVHVTDVKNVIIWGNTSSNNLHLDFNHATATTNDGEKPVQHLVDHKLLNKEFITDVRKGCAEIFDPKKPTSVLFVASAICDHMSDWINGTPKGRWVSMGVYSDGNSYEVPKDIFYSFPVTCENGEWKIVQDLHICNCARKKMVTAADELVEERDEALKYAGSNVNVFNRFKVLTDCFPMKKPVKVLVTGGAGQVAYALVPLIARGLMLGQDQPVKLHMLCSAEDVDALNDVKMELLDIDALPLLQDVVATCNVEEAFDGVAIAIMLDGFIPKEGMAKKYVIAENVSIYKGHAAALEKHAAENCKVVVVANPANINALVLKRLAPKIPPKNITCLTRLEHNRALAQIARGLHVDAVHVKNVIIWGNQSSTLYPDVDYAKVTTLNGDKWIIDFVTDAWLEREFMTNIVGQRDAEIMEARKQSNAALSAVTAVCDHMRDWILGTPEGTWVSMGVYSDGESYDAPSDVYCSFPVTCKNEEWTIVRDLTISKFSRDKMVATALELVEERDLALASIGAK